ncbi:MAG: stage III sporulation protein AE, partial [Clostridiales bacterium]|nr:stage III sporulation protein AE [Clostridiales bacterium]
LTLLLLYLGLSVIGNLLSGLQIGGTAGLSGVLFRAILGGLVLAAIWSLIETARACLLGFSGLMDIFQPVLVGVLLLLGGSAGAAALQSGLALLGGGIIGTMAKVVFPLAIISGVLGVLDLLGGSTRVSELGKLAHKACKWLIGICASLYLLATTVTGLMAAAADSVLIKTSKLAAGSLPLVGGLVSDSLDTAYGCIVLVRQGVGLTGIALGLAWLLRPVILLAVNILVLRGASALSVPLAGGKIHLVFARVADMLSLLLSAIAAAAALFVVTVGLAMGIGKSL